MRLQRKPDALTPSVSIGPTTRAVVGPFDVLDRINELIVFHPWQLPPLPDTWGIGAIIGGSGSGKTLLLNDLGGATPAPVWHPDTPIADHFDPDDVADRLAAVGLNDVPTWCRPYKVLSNGQRFRADLARQIGDRAIIDEFTSVVSRPVAMSTCHGLRRWVDSRHVRGLVVASCHHDIEDWLRPDWVIDTDLGVFRDGPPGRRHWQIYPVAELRLELDP